MFFSRRKIRYYPQEVFMYNKDYLNMYDKMNVALKKASEAYEKGEIPVGCAIFLEGKLITATHNLSEENSDPTDHAELIAIKEAVKKLGRKKIRDSELFVTLEPCPMCAGAIIHAGIKNIYFGSFDKTSGGCDGFVNLFTHPYAKGTNIYAGIAESDCNRLLTSFFEKIRRNNEK